MRAQIHFGRAWVILSLTLGSTLRPAQGDDWPEWLGSKRDGIWRESGVLKTFPADGPKVLWRTPIGSGYAGPAVAGGRVYVTDRQLAEKAANPADPFARGSIPGRERVLCLDADSGQILWKHAYDCAYTVSYPAGPRATPIIRDGRVYTLGAEGDLFCLESGTGQVAWSRSLTKEFSAKTPTWGFAAHPLLDGPKLICLAGGPGSTVLAFDAATGRELWRALTASEPGYAPPILLEAAGVRQLIIWHPDAIVSLNPESGDILWTEPWKIRAGLTVSMPQREGDFLFFTSFYNGSKMLRLRQDKPGAEVVWQSKKISEKDTDALHSIIPTPVFRDGHIYGVCSYGQLRCLNAQSGERLWSSMAATTGGPEVRWANAFLIPQDDRYFIFNEQGDLIIAQLDPSGYREVSRAHVLDAIDTSPGRPVVWSHPAFAQRTFYGRNDREIIAVSLAAP